MIMFLGLTSFLIPVESGERIGFVTTILLAMTVFLLLIPSFLPETSDGVPILGIGLQATVVLIALVLLANILVLKVFFMEGTPPDWLQNFYSSCCCKKGRTVQRIHASNTDVQGKPVIKPDASMGGIELAEREGGRITTPRVWEAQGDEVTWQKVSVKLDHVFFLLFTVLATLTYVVTYFAL